MQFAKTFVRKLFDFGLQSQLDKQKEDILRGVARLNSIAFLHQKTFGEFKNCHQGKDIVIIGAGPTVSKFKPIPDCIYIGLNRACMLANIKFTYLFTIDKIGIDKLYPEFASVDCLKFVGDQNNGPAYQIPESEIAKMGNVRRYKTEVGLYSSSHFTPDIATEPLGNFNTVSLHAMQFALFTNPRRIYIVGIDCTSNGHFDEKKESVRIFHQRIKARGENNETQANQSVEFWHQLKKFADIYYPETEIVSVNPVGLRGLFKDLDQ